MYLEASGKPEKAAEVYASTLVDKPGDDLMTKRMVCAPCLIPNVLRGADLVCTDFVSKIDFR